MCSAAASASSSAGGAAKAAAASSRAYSAKAPPGSTGVPITRSPARSPATTSPHSSTPGVKGSGGRTWYRPRTISASGKLTAAARTRTSSWSGPGAGQRYVLGQPQHLARLAQLGHLPGPHPVPRSLSSSRWSRFIPPSQRSGSVARTA